MKKPKKSSINYRNEIIEFGFYTRERSQDKN